MQAWRKFLNNPCGKSVGDCAVRAISVALGLTWWEAYDLLCAEGRRACDMPSADAVSGAVLRAAGFRRHVIPNVCPDCYTAEDFCKDHPEGVCVLYFGGHVAAVRDGVVWDSWQSTAETPLYYYSRR